MIRRPCRWLLPLLLGVASVASGQSAGPGLPAGFEVLRTLAIGAAPHGIRFSADGGTAYVALAGDDQIAVVDLAAMRVVDRWPAGHTPLDLVPLDTGGWAVTQFRGDSKNFLNRSMRSLSV